MHELLSALHLHAPDLMAGLFGGLVASFFDRNSRPWHIVGSVVIGMFTGNYLAAAIGEIIPSAHEAPAFVAGLVGRELCKRWINAAKHGNMK